MLIGYLRCSRGQQESSHAGALAVAQGNGSTGSGNQCRWHGPSGTAAPPDGVTAPATSLKTSTGSGAARLADVGDFIVRASRPLGAALSPLLFWQGRTVQRAMPKLPEAAGPRHGTTPPTPSADPGTASAGSGAASGHEPRACSLVFFGESTAAGVGVQTVPESLAGQLAQLLSARGTEVTWSILGHTGYTAHRARVELLDRVEGRHDLIVVMLGVNDVLAMTPVEQWRRTVSGLLDVLRTRLSSDGRLILTGVPRVDTFTIMPQPLRGVLGLHARALDNELADLARRFPRVHHLITPPIPDERFLAADGFHPSAQSYTRWAHQIDELLQSLESS